MNPPRILWLVLPLALLCLAGSLILGAKPELWPDAPENIRAYLIGGAILLAFFGVSRIQYRAQREVDQDRWTDLFD